MPWFTCPICKHRDHAVGTPTLPCTNPQPCRGTMTADPPRPPADFGPGHVAERQTLRAAPPPVAAAAPELFGGPVLTAPELPPSVIASHLTAAGVGLDHAVSRVLELEQLLTDAERRAGAANRQLDDLERNGFHARKPDRSWFACADCGAPAKAEEDGTCAGCGRSLSQIHAWDGQDGAEATPPPSDVRRPGLAAVLRGLAHQLAATRAGIARLVAQRLRDLAAELTPPPPPAPAGDPATLDDVHAARAAVEAGAMLLPVHRDPKPDNVTHDDASAHHVGTMAERIRVATGAELDAIGQELQTARTVGVPDDGYRAALLRIVSHAVLRPVAAALPPAAVMATSRALELIADMREVAELCSSGAGYADEVRPLTVLNTLATLERRLTEGA